MSSELVGYNEWLSLYATQTDIIRIKNIALSAFAGHDGWGRRKEQQVIISISVALTGSFYTASGSDVVDSSTIHYGNLGKNITTAVDEKTESKIWQDDIELAKLISNVAKETASNPSLLSSCVVTVYFPKGLVHGEGAGLRYCISFASDKYAACRYLKNVRLPLLLGVNDYERKKKQMVIANIWLDGTNKLLLDSSFAGLEERYVKAVEETSFETIEALLRHTIDIMMKDSQDTYGTCASLRIRLEKPGAMLYAECPGVEMCRFFTK